MPAGRPSNQRLRGNRSNLGPGTTAYVTELQGFNVLADHFWAMAELAPDFFTQLLDVTSDIGIEYARELVPVSAITDEEHLHTRDSINKRPGVIDKGHRGEWSVRFGPTTYYAAYIEYGTRYMAPRPFMIPAGDLAEKVLFASVDAFLNLFDTDNGGFGIGGGDLNASRAFSDSRVKGSIGSARSFLYSSAKFLGDVSVFGGRDIIGPARGVMYSLAKGLGDVNAVMRGQLNTRISRRLSGRATGRIAGYGSASLSTGTTYSAFPGGEGGRRVYQRAVGRFTNLGVSGLSFTNF